MDQESDLQIKAYLKTLSPLDLYQLGIIGNIDLISMNEIIENIIGTYEHTKTLENIIQKDFKIEGVLLPKDPATQSIIIKDYSEKYAALSHALNSQYILKSIREKYASQQSQESKQSI